MRRITLGVVFLVGCAAGGVASRIGVPAAGAQAATVRWEYMCIDGWAGVTHSSNQLGKDGWDMAAAAGTADHMMWCFKRRRP